MIEEQEVHQPENNDNDQILASLENDLRDLIEHDPYNFQAKLKLSRLLLNKGSIQEAKFIISEVEKSKTDEKELQDNSGHSEKQQNEALKLQMLGFLYMNPNMSKMSLKEKPSLKSTDSYIGVAMEKFFGSISISKDSDEAYWGLGRNLKIGEQNFILVI